MHVKSHRNNNLCVCVCVNFTNSKRPKLNARYPKQRRKLRHLTILDVRKIPLGQNIRGREPLVCIRYQTSTSHSPSDSRKFEMNLEISSLQQFLSKNLKQFIEWCVDSIFPSERMIWQLFRFKIKRIPKEHRIMSFDSHFIPKSATLLLLFAEKVNEFERCVWLFGHATLSFHIRCSIGSMCCQWWHVNVNGHIQWRKYQMEMMNAREILKARKQLEHRTVAVSIKWNLFVIATVYRSFFFLICIYINISIECRVCIWCWYILLVKR